MSKLIGMAERAVVRGVWTRGGLETHVTVTGGKKPKRVCIDVLVRPETVGEALQDLHRGGGGKRTPTVAGALKRARSKVHREPCTRRKKIPVTWQMQFLSPKPHVDPLRFLYRC